MKLSTWIVGTLTAAAMFSLASIATAADLGGPKTAAPAPAPAPAIATVPAASCYLGASIGTGATVTTFGAGEISADLGSDGYLGGGEAGCDMRLGAFVIGGLARYDWNNIGGTIEGRDVDAGGMWTIAAKGGIDLNKGTTIYALAGIAGTKIEVEGIDSASHRGLMLGAGIEVAIANGPFSVFAEYNRIQFGRETYSDGEDAAGIDPVVHVGRLGGRFRF